MDESAPTPTEMAHGRRRTLARYLSTPFRAAGERLLRRTGSRPSVLASTSGTPRRGHGAIERVEDDRLNRAILAYDLALRLDSPPADEGYVLGLVGPWGSGKSSLMNLVALHVAPRDIIIRFNPWLYSDTNELVNRFLTDVRNALPRWKNWRLRWSIAQYAGALEPIGRLGFLTPGMPIWTAIVGVVVRRFGGARTPEQERDVIREALSRLEDRRLIVLVDDMDRLAPPEVVEMVRLMKLVGDFPRTSYLVTYDRAHVEHALKTVHGERATGRAYLEKIVQSTQLVPHVEPRTVAGLLVEELEDAVGEYLPKPLSEMPRWPAVQRSIVMPLVRTMRDVRRYVDVAAASLNVNGNEVDPTDVLGLEAVRLFAPDVYDTIAPNASLLTRRGFQMFALKSSETEKKELEELLNRIEDAHQDLAEKLLRNLFPTAHGHLTAEYFTGEDHDGWLRERRVATLPGLLTYLTNAVGEDVVDSELAEQALRALSVPEQFRALVTVLPEAKLRDLMRRLNASEIVFDPTTAAGTVAVLFSLVRNFELEARTPFQPAVEMYVAPLAERLLMGVPDGDRDRATEDVFVALDHPYERLLFLRYFGTLPPRNRDNTDTDTDVGASDSHEHGGARRYASAAMSAQLLEVLRAQVMAASAEELVAWGRLQDMLRILVGANREDGKARLVELLQNDEFLLHILVGHAHEETDESREPPEPVVMLQYDALASIVGRKALADGVERLWQNRPGRTLSADEDAVLATALNHARGLEPVDD